MALADKSRLRWTDRKKRKGRRQTKKWTNSWRSSRSEAMDRLARLAALSDDDWEAGGSKQSSMLASPSEMQRNCESGMFVTWM
jgi:hypothetical protein